jgi:hypothetical protein
VTSEDYVKEKEEEEEAPEAVVELADPPAVVTVAGENSPGFLPVKFSRGDPSC